MVFHCAISRVKCLHPNTAQRSSFPITILFSENFKKIAPKTTNRGWLTVLSRGFSTLTLGCHITGNPVNTDTKGTCHSVRMKRALRINASSVSSPHPPTGGKASETLWGGAKRRMTFQARENEFLLISGHHIIVFD